MKSQERILNRGAVVLAIFVLSGACCISAAQSENSPAPSGKASSQVATNSPAEAPIPQSVFVAPSTPGEGRDPFFPNLGGRSTSSGQSTNKSVTPPRTFELTLQGISGSGTNKLAIINGRSFGLGEQNDVPTPGGGRVQIRCLKINETSAVIEIGGESRELEFQPAK